MSQTAVERTKKGDEPRKRGFFAQLMLFFRQVIDELKKVVTPTRKELVNYSIVVIVFVIIIMLLVTLLDFLFGSGAAFVFGDGNS